MVYYARGDASFNGRARQEFEASVDEQMDQRGFARDIIESIQSNYLAVSDLDSLAQEQYLAGRGRSITADEHTRFLQVVTQIQNRQIRRTLRNFLAAFVPRTHGDGQPRLSTGCLALLLNETTVAEEDFCRVQRLRRNGRLGDVLTRVQTEQLMEVTTGTSSSSSTAEESAGEAMPASSRHPEQSLRAARDEMTKNVDARIQAQEAELAESRRQRQQHMEGHEPNCEHESHFVCHDSRHYSHHPRRNPWLVRRIIHALLCTPNGQDGPCCFDARRSHGKVTPIKGNVQMGKTRLMVCLTWLLACKYDVNVSIIGLFGNTAAYSATRNSIRVFNSQVRDILRRYIVSSDEQEYYTLHYCDTHSSSGGHIPQSWLDRGYPVCHGRLGTPGNLRTITKNVLPFVAAARCVGAEPLLLDFRLNIAFFLDEWQNYYQSTSKSMYQKETVAHRSCFDGIRQAVENGLSDDLSPDERNRQRGLLRRAYRDRGGFTFRNCMRFQFGTSATHNSSWLNEPDEVMGPMITVSLVSDYMGFSKTLPTKQQIPIEYVSIARLERRENVRANPLDDAPYIFDIIDQRRCNEHFEHLAIYNGISGGRGMGLNCNIDNISAGIIDYMADNRRPTICFSYYGRREDHGCRMVFNRAATPLVNGSHFGGGIRAADEALFMTTIEARTHADVFGKKNGDSVLCHDRRTRVINSQAGRLRVNPLSNGAVEVLLPSGQLYRIAQMFDLLKEMIEQCNDPSCSKERLFVITVSSGLMKEGVSIKASDHDCALTAMTVIMTQANINKMDYTKIQQLLGRLAGRYPVGAPIPVMYIPFELCKRHREAYTIDHAVTRAVIEGTDENKPPVQCIMDANTGLQGLRENIPLVPKKCQPAETVSWLKANCDGTITAMDILEAHSTNRRTPENVMRGQKGYRRLLRELFYRPGHAVSEATFFALKEITGPAFLTPGQCGISAAPGQNGGLLWRLGDANRAVGLIDKGDGDRDYPIVREMEDGVFVYGLSSFMCSVADRLQYAGELPDREEELAAVESSEPYVAPRPTRRRRSLVQARPALSPPQDENLAAMRTVLEVACCISKEECPVNKGLYCKNGHFLSEESFDGYVDHLCRGHTPHVDMDRLFREGRPLGQIVCPHRDDANRPCTSAPYDAQQVSMYTSPPVFRAYLSLVSNLLRMVPSEAGDESDDRVALQLQQLFPYAYQCGRCGTGPVLHAGCDDLQSHNGQVMSHETAVTNNACPRCGWFVDDIRDWPRWNGQLVNGEHAAAGSSSDPAPGNGVEVASEQRRPLTIRLRFPRRGVPSVALTEGEDGDDDDDEEWRPDSR